MDRQLLLSEAANVPSYDFSLPQHIHTLLSEAGVGNPNAVFCFAYGSDSILGRLYPFSEAMDTIMDNQQKANQEIFEALYEEEGDAHEQALISFIASMKPMHQSIPADLNLIIQAFEAGACSPPKQIQGGPEDAAR